MLANRNTLNTIFFKFTVSLGTALFFCRAQQDNMIQQSRTYFIHRPNFLLGGASVCQKTGVLLPAEQWPLPAGL